jgi:hypothetical protein
MVRMITLKQAVEETGMSETALRAYVTAGKVPATRAGNSTRGKILFEADELNKALVEIVRRNLTTTEPQPEVVPEVAKGDHEGEVIPFTVFRNVK